MLFLCWQSLMRRVFPLGCAAMLMAGFANAQSAVSDNNSTAGWSSSQSNSLQLAEAAVPRNPAALPSVPAPAASGAAAQNDNDANMYSGWHGHDILHRLTIEAGFGANGPAGDKPYITWGDQFTIGGGVNINHNLAALIEYQFIDDKLPGHIIAEAGATGGHVHLWSLTVDPVYDFLPKASNDFYVTGGGGLYRKVTSFTNPQASYFCSYYYCAPGYTNVVVGHYSSNEGGFNIGGGYQHRFGSVYGDTSRTRIYAEVRYVDAFSPAVTTQANGLGTTSVAADTKVIPITLGVRW
jgi:hypothetical protein